MKKIIITIAVVMILISLATAGILIGNRTIDFTTESENILKATNDITKIEIDINQTICDGSVCITKVYQKGLINDFYRTEQYKDGVEKTSGELQTELDAWLLQRIESYANVQDTRRNRDIEVIDEGGIITKSR